MPQPQTKKKLDGRDETQKHLLLGVVNVQPLTKKPATGWFAGPKEGQSTHIGLAMSGQAGSR